MDLTGNRYGSLSVLSRVEDTALWLCRCDCGAEVEIWQSELLSGHKKSCGCLKKQLRGSDITGMRSGKLVAVRPTEEKRRGAALWLCKCDCGRELLTEAYKIRRQAVRSCGCTRGEKRTKDLTGQRFGRLTAVERTGRKCGSSYLWKCRCDCGGMTEATAASLLSGHSSSCGCMRSDAMRSTNEKYGIVTDRLRLIDGTSVDRIERKNLQKNNTSGYTGVQARNGKWIAVITFKKKVYYLGMYSRLEDAVKVRQEAEDALFGEFLDWYYREIAPIRAKTKE